MQLAPGTTVGTYAIVREIGRGAMGVSREIDEQRRERHRTLYPDRIRIVQGWASTLE